MFLKEEVIRKVRKDVALKNEIAELYECSSETVRRWTRDNRIELTSYACLNLISKWYNIPKSQLIDEN